MPPKKVKLSTIKLNPDNPRFIRDERYEKLVKSLADAPWMMQLRPIIVDENNIALGGNMRRRALEELKYKEIPEEWVVKANDLTEEQKREFIIKDNIGFGNWDYEILANDWDEGKLIEWGMEDDLLGLGEDFDLPNEDKPPLQQMTFTLADEQAEEVKKAIAEVKSMDEFYYVETHGNENGNGNALYLLVKQWAELKTLG